MRLSEAIRIGAKKRPQCFQCLYLHPTDPLNKDGVIQSCGLGAGLEGAGLIDPEQLDYPCEPYWNPIDFDGVQPFGSRTDYQCPAGCTYSVDAIEQVVHLNDGHQWSREQIADWLERIGL